MTTLYGKWLQLKQQPVHLIISSYSHIHRNSTKAFAVIFEGYSRVHIKWIPVTEAGDKWSGHRPVHTAMSPDCVPSVSLLQQVPSDYQEWWNVASSSSFKRPFLVSFTHLFKITYLSVETVASVSLSLSITMDVYQWAATKLATSACTVFWGEIT